MNSSYTREDGLSARRQGLRRKVSAVCFAGAVAMLLTTVLGCAAAKGPESEPYPAYQQEPVSYTHLRAHET